MSAPTLISAAICAHGNMSFHALRGTRADKIGAEFFVIFYFSHYCFVFPLALLSFIQLLPYYFASDLAIIQNSLIGSICGNRCLSCNVCVGGAQNNNSVGHNVTVLPGVTVVDFHPDVVISDC